MQNIKEKVAVQINVSFIAQFILLSSIATILPFFIHVQWLTGSIVNAVLVLTLFTVGVRSALLVCLIPSLVALTGGLLPVVLAPVVPFIMVSNMIYVLFVDYIFKMFKKSEQGYWFGITIASTLKFLFLSISVNMISDLLFKQELLIRLSQMMSWPQLYTAFIGGMLAFIVLKTIKSFRKDKI